MGQRFLLGQSRRHPLKIHRVRDKMSLHFEEKYYIINKIGFFHQ